MFCKVCGGNAEKIFDANNIHGRYIFSIDENFEVYSCSNCGAVFIADILIDLVYYEKYYPKNYYNELRTGLISYIIDLIARISVKFREKHILNNLNLNGELKFKILDIGCGSGRFLTDISEDKFEKYGIEINPEGYEICKGRGIKVYNQDLKDINFEDNFFDIITLWHVIEHINTPYETMSIIKRILKNDGILVMTTPNTDSFGFKYGQKLWFHLDTPRHLILYNMKSLDQLMNKAGFNISQRKNMVFDFPLDLFWSVRKSWIKYFFYPFYPVFKTLSKETILLVCKKQ